MPVGVRQNADDHPPTYPAAAAQGAPLWQTEFTDPGADTDPTIDSALRVGNAVHDFLTIAEGNAWHYWWLVPRGDNPHSTGSLVENGVMAKRGWALGNWARFVRPGQRRVQTYGSTDTVRVTAFVSSTTRRFTVVAVNADATARTVPLAIADATAPSLTPWETSASRSLEPLAAVAPAADGSFTLSLPARSVTTFVSEALNRTPQSLALDNPTVAENQPAGTVIGTLSATDPDVGETFAYALIPGIGDTDNAAFTISGNQLLTAAPFDFETTPARTVRIRAIDTAGASFERAFTLAVLDASEAYSDWSASLPLDQRSPDTIPAGGELPNLLVYAFGYAAGQHVPRESLPALVAANSGAGQLAFTFTLPANPPPDLRYEIEHSTDFSTWTVLATKEGDSAWATTAELVAAPPVVGFTTVRLTITTPAVRVFYRLRTTFLPAP